MILGFQEILVESPSDKIISQIRALIDSGELNEGDRLPSERKMAERFGVGRAQVRDAIAKLEFYGLVKTLPQSGTIVEGAGLMPIEGLITNVLKIEESTFSDLVDTRVILETQAARMAADRRTEQDIEIITEALNAYKDKVMRGLPAVEEDLFFHLKIADASHNSVLKSLLMVIIPDIVKNFTKLEVCTPEGFHGPLEEHKTLLKHIINREGELACKAMKHHLKDVLSYSKKIKDLNIAHDK